jgi:hypothetical protein
MVRHLDGLPSGQDSTLDGWSAMSPLMDRHAVWESLVFGESLRLAILLRSLEKLGAENQALRRELEAERAKR